MNGKMKLSDRKNPFAEGFWNTINHMVVGLKFPEIEVTGSEYIPQAGPFLLVCNHTSRWDGLVVRKVVGRRANYMVSPNELTGFQGAVLRSVGAFPANPRYDLVSFMLRRVEAGEGIVIFPEGDVFRDGSVHPFKNGAARMALSCACRGINLPVVAMAIVYDERDRSAARCVISPPVFLEPYLQDYSQQSNIGIRALTVRLEREVCLLRTTLGCAQDSYQLAVGRTIKQWVPGGSRVSQESASRENSRSCRRIFAVEDGLSDGDRAQASA